MQIANKIGPAYLLLAGLAYAGQFVLIEIREFDTDELQHLHAAWSMGQGLVPFRDFFEHHGPALWALLAAPLVWLKPELNAERAINSLVMARQVSWALTGGLLALTWFLTKRWRGRSAAHLAVALLATTPMFLEKALEVRPDLWAVSLVLLAVLCLDKSLSTGRKGMEAASGAAFGLALLFSPKAIFALPALLLIGSGKRRRAFWILGAGAPLAIAVLYFASHEALGIFIRCLLLNSQWPTRFSPAIFAGQLISQSPLLVAAGIGGWLVVLRRTLSANKLDAICLIMSASFLAGLFVIPIPYKQYFLFLIPWLAIFGGAALDDLIRKTSSMLTPGTQLPQLVALLCLCVASLYALNAQTRSERNTLQLALIQYVSLHTQPTDRVLDGWTGLGVFRPHVGYYWFLHHEIRLLLSEKDKQTLYETVRSDAQAPELVFLDAHLRALHPELTSFLEKRYRPEVGNVIWRRR